MRSSSEEDISDESPKKSPGASLLVEEFVDSPKPYVSTEAQEYFPSQPRSTATRAKTPPYTCWKNENIHLYTHELQSNFGRQLQNSNEFVYSPSTSSPPGAHEKPSRRKFSKTDVVNKGDEPVIYPAQNLKRSPQTEPRINAPQCYSCSNPSPSQPQKRVISTHQSPCHPPLDSYHYISPHSSQNDSQSCHCCCTSPRTPHRRSNDRSPPRRKKSQEKKDVPVDLYRIVLLQNQQLGELQKQVKKLTQVVDAMQREASENTTVRVNQKSRMSSTGVQTYCEEKLSVGVMTSIIQVPLHQKKDTEESSSSGEAAASSSSASRDEFSRNARNRSRSRKSKQISPPSNLRSKDIPAIEDRPPSPPASVHVEMPEYDSSNSSSSYDSSENSSESDDSSEDERGARRHGRPPKIGWTYYDAVVGKVNEMLSEGNARDHYDHEVIKQATLDHLISIGVSFAELDLQQSNKRVTFNNKQMPVVQRASDETDTSMRLNALAMKYLKEDQVKHNGTKPKPHFQPSSPLANNTNFSFATMRYLERHQLVPGQPVKTPTTPRPNKIKKSHATDHMRHEERKMTHSKKKKSHNGKEERHPSGRHHNGDDQINKILDITAIKNQPKLLPKRY